MHELVTQHVVGFGECARQRQHDTALLALGDAARAFADHAADDVRLFEVRMRGIKDERLARPDFVLEHRGKARIPAFRHLGDAGSALALFFVEIHVEVFGLEHFELEIPVLNFVAPEILRLRG